MYRPARARICFLRSPESIPSLAGWYDKPNCCTGSPGYIGWRNRFLGIIPGLLKRLQIGAQATLASGIGSLESIPGLLKRLQIGAQATTLASGIGSLESIPWLHNMKNEDEANFFLSKRIYSSLNYRRNEDEAKYLFLNFPRKEEEAKYLFLNYRRNGDEAKYLFLNYRRNEDEVKYLFLNY